MEEILDSARMEASFAVAEPMLYADIVPADKPRLLTGIPELNRVLGGGVVVGSLQLIGLLGFLVYMLAFSWVQIGWMDGNGAKYSLCNVLAASLVAVSLIAEFNLSSALIQGSWILIGLVGLVKRQVLKVASQGSAPVSSQEVM